ncbi:MAG TPA: asparaginase, partial [candidate division Zixibacteria bacterium]
IRNNKETSGMNPDATKSITNMNGILVKVYRGKTIESVHCGSVAVVDSKGKLIYSFGDPYFVTYLRSSAKPFQTISLITSGAAKEFGLTRKEIAIISGSHNGQKIHTDTVKSVLKKIGLSEKNLQCGVHIPHYYTANNITPPPGKIFTPVHHNCSGKHSGILALCVYFGWDIKSYLDKDHPAQKMIFKAISEICQYPEKKIGIGIDGCGVPVHAMPIYNMAVGFSNLINYKSKDERIFKAYKLIVDSMRKYPEMVSGEGRLDLNLAIASKYNILTKAGGEALSCSGILDRGWGMAVKIADGTQRAIGPAAVETLKQMGLLNEEQIVKIKKFSHPLIKNFRGDQVGYIKAEFKLKRRK